MSKKTEVMEAVKTNHTTELIDTSVKAKEAIDTLRVQLREHLQQVDNHRTQAENHRTMATKAQGALEVLLQLYPEEDNSEG